MPFELQGWIQKSLEKMLVNFNYCIFEANLNEEDLHAQIQITAEGKGVLVRINKRLSGDRRKLELTPNIDDFSYRHKFVSMGTKCDFLSKTRNGLAMCELWIQVHNHCKSLSHRTEKCVSIGNGLLDDNRVFVCELSCKCITICLDEFKKVKKSDQLYCLPV
jgi:hypothetical protein